MKVKIKVEKDVEATEIKLNAGVRFWEDATVNGTECSVSGVEMPFCNRDTWCPSIDVNTGTIKDWPKKTVADVHFKVCDSCIADVLDDNGNIIFSHDGYVPDILCPEGGGCGDYIIMSIDESGKIKNWDSGLIQRMYQDSVEE